MAVEIGRFISKTKLGAAALIVSAALNFGPSPRNSTQEEQSSYLPNLSASTLLIDNHSALASPEYAEQLITVYAVEDLRVTSDGHMIELTSFLDGTKHVVTGILDPSTGKVNPSEKGIPPLYARAVTCSETNPNLMLAVGDEKPAADKGRIWKTTDGGVNWQLISYDQGGTMFDAQITSDNKYAFIAQSNHYQENGVNMARLNLSDNTVSNLPINGATGGQGVGSITEYSAMASPDTYSSRGILPINPGYQKFTTTSTSVQAQQLNPQEGYTEGKLTQFTDLQGRKRIELINPHTLGIPPNDPNKPISTLYDNIDDVMSNTIQPKNDLYIEIATNTIFISTIGSDPSSDDGFMGVGVDSDNNQRRSYIERYSKSNPNDLSKRFLLPRDGAWPAPQTDHDLVEITSHAVVVKNGKKFHIASVKRSEWVLDPTTNIRAPVLRQGSLLTRDVTNGINSTDVWKENPITMIVSTPTPTSTATPTPTPTTSPEATRSATSTPLPKMTPAPTGVQNRLYIPLVDKRASP